MRTTRDVGFWVLAAAILGSSMSFIDSTVVYVVLPVLQKELNATVIQAQWIVEAYVLLQASLILVGGSLADRFGRKRVFAAGTLLFAAASAFCGLATDANQLITARFMQALGGALLAPSSLAIITAYFHEGKRGRAIGAWSGASALFAAIGPLLGGFLAQTFSWRWVFFINLPMAAVTLITLYIYVPESKDDEVGGSVDWLGAALGVVGLGGITYGLIESSNLGLTSPVVLSSVALGLVSLGLFVLHESRMKHPMVPLSLFRSPTFSAANLLTLLLNGGLAAMIFFLPFNLLQVQGYTVIQAGASFLPLSIILGALSHWAGGLWHKYGAKLPLTIGPLIVAVSFVMFGSIGIGGSYWLTFFPAIIVLAFGATITAAPLTTTVMSAAPSRLSGTASGINNTLLSTANVLAVALLGVVALQSFSASLNKQIQLLDLPPIAVREITANKVSLANLEAPNSLDANRKAAVNHAVDQAFIDAFRNIMYICAGLAVASAGVAWLWIEGGGDTPPAQSKKGK